MAALFSKRNRRAVARAIVPAQNDLQAAHVSVKAGNSAYCLTREKAIVVIEDRLIAAVQRGVTVRVVMSPAPTGSDANAVGQGRTTRGGVQLRFVKMAYIHAQIIIADNARAFVGSQNISTVSLDSNRELGILLADPRVIQAFLWG